MCGWWYSHVLLLEKILVTEEMGKVWRQSKLGQLCVMWAAKRRAGSMIEQTEIPCGVGGRKVLWGCGSLLTHAVIHWKVEGALRDFVDFIALFSMHLLRKCIKK